MNPSARVPAGSPSRGSVGSARDSLGSADALGGTADAEGTTRPIEALERLHSVSPLLSVLVAAQMATAAAHPHFGEMAINSCARLPALRRWLLRRRGIQSMLHEMHQSDEDDEEPLVILQQVILSKSSPPFKSLPFVVGFCIKKQDSLYKERSPNAPLERSYCHL